MPFEPQTDLGGSSDSPPAGGGAPGGGGGGTGAGGGGMAPVQSAIPFTDSLSNVIGIRILIVSATLPAQGPAYPVFPGEAVYIRPLNSAGGANVGVVNVALYGSAAVSGSNADVLRPTDLEREFPVRDISEIFVGGANVNDGVVISIRRRPDARR